MPLRRKLASLAAVLAFAGALSFLGGAASADSGNGQVLISTSTPRATSTPLASRTNLDSSGIVLYVKPSAFGTGTASAGTASVAVKVQGYDLATDTWYDVPGCTTGALTSTAQKFLICSPGVKDTSNESAPTHLPVLWRTYITVAGSGGTLSIGGNLLK